MIFENLEVIKKNRKPVMIWASLKEEIKFSQLAMQLRSVLPGDSSKAPVPHVTLARVKGKLGNIPPLPELKQLEFDVNQIELMESDTGNPAPVYKSVKTFEFDN